MNSKINNFINKDNSITPLNWVLPNKKEFVNWITETFIKYRADGKLPVQTKNFSLFKYQKFLRDYMQNNSPYRGVLLYHSLGSGKCLKRGTKIIMANGTIKNVEDIRKGELLMGDDSKPRIVLSLAQGVDKMYEITPKNGEKYTVNSEHILCLKGLPTLIENNLIWIENNAFQSKVFNTKNEANEFLEKLDTDNIIEISIKDYLKLTKIQKKILKGYKVSIDFPEKSVPIDPYIVGHWLSYKKNIEKRYIPALYKYNSIQNRLKLLAGLTDNGAQLNNNIFIFNDTNEILIDDIVYLCRSLGFLTNKIVKRDLISVSIEGNIDKIPNLNTFNTFKKIKENSADLLLTDIKVKYVNVDDYYGFMLDGNCRFLFGDFTVTHNTCTAIGISENLKTERNVVVMLPASLRTNFIVDGLMFCGSSKYKNNPEAYKEKYSFISYNANNTTAQIKKIGSLDNKVIIIEEVHNLISKIISGISGVSKQGLEIYNLLMNAQNAKIIALSGTPLINDPFEAGVLFNILRGYIEITYFRILKIPGSYNNEWKLGNLEEDLMSNKLIDYLEINKFNKSIEFHIKVKSYSAEYREVLDFIENTCSNKGIIVKFLDCTNTPLFPIDNDGEVFRNYFVKEDYEKGDNIKNEDVFKRRILGLVSYYKSNSENYPKVIMNDPFKVEMSKYQFQIYEILRAKERLSERGPSKSKESVKSTFRVFSRQASNFVFPEEIYRPYPDPAFIVSLSKKNDNVNITKMLKEEEKANEEGKLREDYKNRIDVAINMLVENGQLYLTPGLEGLDKLSPKMKLILENINKSHGLIFVYSNFRTLEGIELFSKILDFNGYSKYGTNNDLKKYAIYSGSEDEKEKKKLLKIFTSKENKHGKFMKILLSTAAGAEGLDLKNIRQIHIMEPYWNQTRIEQVIGRGVRRNSHIELPENERNVEIYRYFSVFSKKNNNLTKDKLSTDQHIEALSKKKQFIINELIQILKECSFDCVLNSADVKREYNCFNFGSGAEGFSYHPNISKDIIESYAIANKKIVQKTLTKAYVHEGIVYLADVKKKIFYLYNDNKKNPQTIDTKKINVIFIDKSSDEAYDKKSVDVGNPIRIGFINADNKLKKKI